VAKQVPIAFSTQGVILPLANILPLKHIKPVIKFSQKYLQVLSSVREVGIIEPLIVFPQTGKSDVYLLLDGHIRLEVLKQIGETDARCLISTDDEAYTYNRRVNRMATIQEHAMILKATRSGVSEERIAKVLKMDVASIRQKRDLLNGICKEAAEILKNRRVSIGVFSFLRKLKAMRQIEVAELLVATGNYSVPYVRALLAATHPDMLVEPDKHKVVEGLTPEQVTKMEKEMEALQRDLKFVEESHGNQVLNLVLARGYLAKMFGNARIVRYLTQHHPDVFHELQAASESPSLET
jgi:ParB-like chromosome segregation protein Spo0J